MKIQILIIIFVFFLAKNLFAFVKPDILNPVNFSQISFDNSILKNTYPDGYMDYTKYYNNFSLTYLGIPKSAHFGDDIKKFEKEKNEVCYGYMKVLEYEFCGFVFTDNKFYYWSLDKNAEQVYAKSEIIDFKNVEFLNECDLKASPSNSPTARFFNIGLEVAVEMNFLIDMMLDDQGNLIDYKPLIKICENEIKNNPNIGRNYVNLYHLEKLNYIREAEKDSPLISDEKLSYLISLLDNAVNSEIPDYRAYYHMGLLNRDGFSSYFSSKRPKDERFTEESSLWMNYFFFAFNNGNIDVANDFIINIKKNIDAEQGYLNYFNWNINELNAWSETYVQEFFMTFIDEFSSSGFIDYENAHLLEEGNEEELRQAFKEEISNISDQKMIYIFTDFFIDKVEPAYYWLSELGTTMDLFKRDDFLPKGHQGWKDFKIYTYTKSYADNSNYVNYLVYDELRYYYENAIGTGYDFDKALEYARKGLNLTSTEFGDEVMKSFKEDIARLERKTLAKVPTTLKINFYCTSEIWSESSLEYIEMEKEYGVMAVRGALSMNVFNNVNAKESFKSNTAYLCSFDEDITILKKDISFMELYSDDKSIVQIPTKGGFYIYSYINN
jgi:hypothetical protein